ncbi:MAG: serine/threonine protein kinase [Cyanobacteria bacterium]|nr:serine/threonine protein kinase [Cyanobacteriota bacterium]
MGAVGSHLHSISVRPRTRRIPAISSISMAMATLMSSSATTLVEGEDLSQRIARGPVPLDEALPIARQIAEALEAAHDHGVIHRDLKPANIKVRSDGTVKVLDFGLAKATAQGSGIGDQGSGNAANSPTLSIHATEAGIILGTAAYMAPEQAKGKAVDRRADIWAFGTVLFEMLTGKRAFAGDDISDTFVSVLRDEPDWSALPVDTPPGAVQAVHVCLRKDPKQRVRDISAVRLLMDGTFDTVRMRASTSLGGESRALTAAWLIAAVTVGAALATAVAWLLMQSKPEPDQPVRALDQLDATPLRGIAGARAPFISPDNQWVGFFSGSVANNVFQLKKVPMTGGPALVICRLTQSVVGAHWGADDTIVFATADRATGLMRVPAAGGDPEILTRPDPARGELEHVSPFVLPGGNAVLFTIIKNAATGALVYVVGAERQQATATEYWYGSIGRAGRRR